MTVPDFTTSSVITVNSSTVGMGNYQFNYTDVNDPNPVDNYVNKWIYINNADPNNYLSDYNYSNGAKIAYDLNGNITSISYNGAAAVVKFYGNRIKLYGPKMHALNDDPNYSLAEVPVCNRGIFGMAKITLDNQTPVNVDCNSPTVIPHALLYDSNTISTGANTQHTLKIEPISPSNPADPNSNWRTIAIDDVEISTAGYKIVDFDDRPSAYNALVGGWQGIDFGPASNGWATQGPGDVYALYYDSPAATQVTKTITLPANTALKEIRLGDWSGDPNFRVDVKDNVTDRNWLGLTFV